MLLSPVTIIGAPPRKLALPPACLDPEGPRTGEAMTASGGYDRTGARHAAETFEAGGLKYAYAVVGGAGLISVLQSIWENPSGAWVFGAVLAAAWLFIVLTRG